ncbi:MAG: hypothetical protein K0R17_1031 [Rariglobus sp.]|jgi:hypothetical protein|nr:hypothetical protein [Rariglobus sp.]
MNIKLKLTKPSPGDKRLVITEEDAGHWGALQIFVAYDDVDHDRVLQATKEMIRRVNAPTLDTKPNWKPADEPPPGTPGHWTRRVIVVTNLGNVKVLAYFWGDREDAGAGVWQREKGTQKDEHPKWWIDKP